MDLSDLRQSAIARLKHDSADGDDLQRRSLEELIHELRVQQIELEMQNDELRRAQLELEESRDRFANLFDFAPVGYVTLDASHRIVEANLTIAKLLGVNRGTLVGQVLSQYIIPDDARQLTSHLRDLGLPDGKSSCEVTLRKSDGSLMWVRIHGISVADESGGNRGRSLAIVDLSKNVELIRAKQDSEERLRVICHALPIPIAYVDRAERYQFNNSAHEDWFKISRESVMGLHVKEVLGEDVYGTLESRIKRALAGHAGSSRLDLPNGDGLAHAVEVHLAPHFEGQNEVAGFFELIIDVSASYHFKEAERKRVELELQLTVLSSRQRAVLDLIMMGKSNKTIAQELDHSMRTIERDRHEIVQLLGVNSINEVLVKFAGLTASDDASGVTQ